MFLNLGGKTEFVRETHVTQLFYLKSLFQRLKRRKTSITIEDIAGHRTEGYKWKNIFVLYQFHLSRTKDKYVNLKKKKET